MSDKRKLKRLLAEARDTFDYALEGAILSFTEQVAAAMAAQGMSRSELAKRVGCSAPYITKIFRGNPNLTLGSMVKIAEALGFEIAIQVRPKRRVAKSAAGSSRYFQAQASSLVLNEEPRKKRKGVYG